MKIAATLPETVIQEVVPHSTSASSATNGGPVQVWLVDDNDDLRGLIAQFLEREGGIVCPRQFDSPNGVLSALASRIGPDVILLDVQMGEFNGLDAIPAIKSLSRSTDVFMLTTFFDPGWHQQAMESGASGYHLKSDSLERLAASICNRDAAGAVAGRPSRRFARHSANGTVRRHVPSSCAEKDLAREAPKSGRRPNWKSGSLLRWFKPIAKK